MSDDQISEISDLVVYAVANSFNPPLTLVTRNMRIGVAVNIIAFEWGRTGLPKPDIQITKRTTVAELIESAIRVSRQAALCD